MKKAIIILLIITIIIPTFSANCYAVSDENNAIKVAESFLRNCTMDMYMYTNHNLGDQTGIFE